jgi:uncharacterized protein HemX
MGTPDERLNIIASNFKALPTKHKAIVVAAFVIIAAILVAASGMVVYRVQHARYTAREAKRMKQVQDALALAEKKTREAEAKEAKAEQIEQDVNAKAKLTTGQQQQLEQETKKRDEDIQNAFQHDQDVINSDMSGCERCRDICARTASLAASNPNLAAYVCSADACDEQCQ